MATVLKMYKMIVNTIAIGSEGAGSTDAKAVSFSTQTSVSLSKTGKAPLAVGDMVVALPETSSKNRSPDITSDTRHVDGGLPPSSDYYA